jgi:hypothetical protein
MPSPTIHQPTTADKEFEGLLSDPEIRRQLRKTLKGFGLLYFSHHLYLAPGEFHDEMISALEDPAIEFLRSSAFAAAQRVPGARSSSRSTLHSKRARTIRKPRSKRWSA